MNENKLALQRQQIDKMHSDAKDEVITVESQLEAFIPTPEVTNISNPG